MMVMLRIPFRGQLYQRRTPLSMRELPTRAGLCVEALHLPLGTEAWYYETRWDKSESSCTTADVNG